MAKYPDRRSAAIPALHLAQEEHGWCSPEAIAQVASVMAVTPAYLTSVATFYDMFKTVPSPRNDVYVCTNISCSLRGADELFEAMLAAARGHADVDVRSFECLGACDIAPMASVNGEYVGPLTTEDAGQIVEDLVAGRPVLEHKQLRFRRCADPGVAEGASDFGPPPSDAPRADTVGLPEGGEPDRPGPTAAIEQPVDEDEGTRPSSEDSLRGHRRAGAGDARRLPPAGRLRGASQALSMLAPGRARPDHDLGDPGPRRRRVPDGQEGLVPAPREHGQVPRVQRRRVRAGHVQGPRAHAEEPAHAHRGDHHRHLRRGHQPGVHLHPRRVRAPGRHPGGGDRRGRAGRADRRANPRLRPLDEPRAAPRRRGIHLWRGDGTARLAGGQARQPAAEAAVPGDRGALPRPDADQQRRDARHRAPHHPHGRRGLRRARDRDLDRDQARLGVRRRAAAGQLRDRARDPEPGDHLRPGRRARDRAGRSSSGSRAAPRARC